LASPGALASALALTLVAISSTIPIALPTFAVFSLVAPLTNLIAGPLFSALLVTGVLAMVVTPFFEPLGILLLNVSVWIADMVSSLAAYLAQIPYASVPLELPMEVAVPVCLACAALLYWRWPLPTARRLRAVAACSLAVICVVALVLPLIRAPRMVVMDVGQGDAILIQEQGHGILIDTGPSDAALVHALARNRVTHLDAVIITHLDADHAGALGRLRGLVSVEKVYFAYGLSEHQPDDSFIQAATRLVGAERLGELALGDRLRLGKTLTLTVIWPEAVATEGSNVESLCLLLQFEHARAGEGEGAHRVLLTGDAESAELRSILQHSPTLSIDILKVGHHGSKKSLTLALLEDLGCSVALISVGAGNRFGHPAPEILDALEECGVRVLRTDELGDLTCLFRGSTPQLRYASMDELS